MNLNYEEIIENITQFFESYTGEILIALALLLIINVIIFLIINFKLRKNLKVYQKLLKGTDGINLEEILMENIKVIYTALNRVKDVESKNKFLEGRINQCINKVSIVRYSANEDAEDDLSFVLALLDNNDSGVLINSLYCDDDQSRTFAKHIDNGNCIYQLTKEEGQALKEAIG